MGLLIPKFIEEVGIIDVPLTYEWEDDNHRSYWARGVPALENKIGKCANRSVVLFSSAIAEWVAWRMHNHSKDRALYDCIEAIYASVIDWRYFERPSKPIKWRKGSVQGPMDVARYLLVKAFRRGKAGEYVSDISVFLCQLVEHICKDSVKPFRKWRDEVIIRLRELEPLNLDNPDGNPLPREALNPKAKFKPEAADRLLEAFLKTLDHATNPYLSSPEKMLKAGFEGIPYKLN